MSDQTWLDMVDDPEADVYDVLRQAYKDSTFWTDHPLGVEILLRRAGQRLVEELRAELPGLTINFLRIAPEEQGVILTASFRIQGGWTGWQMIIPAREIVFARTPSPQKFFADRIAVTAAGYFMDQIRGKDARTR